MPGSRGDARLLLLVSPEAFFDERDHAGRLSAGLGEVEHCARVASGGDEEVGDEFVYERCDRLRLLESCGDSLGWVQRLVLAETVGHSGGERGPDVLIVVKTMCSEH